MIAAVLPLLLLAACDRGGVPFAGHAPAPPEGITYTGPNGETVTAPAGHGMRFKVHESAGSAMAKNERAANGKGTGATSSSAELLQNLNSSAPEANIGGMAASGGTTLLDTALKGGPQTTGLMLASILIGLGGIPVLIWVNRRAGFAMFGLAGCLLAAALMPTWAWAVIGIGAVAGLGLYLYAEFAVKKTETALGTVLGGVEDIDDPTTRVKVKEKVAARAAKVPTNVGKTISKLKTKMRLPSERR